MNGKRSIISMLIILIVVCLLSVLYINNRNKQLDSEKLFIQRVNKIDYVKVQKWSTFRTLNLDEITRLKRIILNNYEQKKYKVEYYNSSIFPVVFHVRIYDEKLIIGYSHKSRELYFYKYWFVSKDEKDIYKAKIQGLLLKVDDEIYKLLQDIGIKL
ncbi:hypothetical protein BBF96_12325 [Anoxybacter fermentans]|uniref:Uncharacterized protein n=1 Tax=Anoxybacter fermentans TaxID=1323375 RepID=A0A3Q9HS97_9FIRM|nr:hypothetical protein [Anoxybacter fermentans]AZR74115.1 hypothetical protein BBF96_12325 [Anoxybacter fermentans]